MIRRPPWEALVLGATLAGVVAVLSLPSASSADPAASATAAGSATSAPAAPPSPPPPPCEEVCRTAIRAIGECDLKDACRSWDPHRPVRALRALDECDVSAGSMRVAVGEQARRTQLDCKAFCATLPPEEVGRLDACYPRERCSDYRACLSTVGATMTPTGVSTRERDGAEMVTIPGGAFMRGVPTAARTLQDADRSTAEVATFRIDRYEVTVAQYQRCYADGACPPPGVDGQIDPATAEKPSSGEEPTFGVTRPSRVLPRELQGCNWKVPERTKHPVNCVDYRSAKAYCRWAGARLPSELEWEKAARGEDGRRYPWGFSDRTCLRLVWDPSNSLATRGCSARATHEVGSLPGGNSPYGVSDLGGNVWEWVGGMYDAKEYADPKTDNQVVPAQVYGVVRGGGWGRDEGDVVSHDTSTRFRWFKEHRIEGVGFRCATEAP